MTPTWTCTNCHLVASYLPGFTAPGGVPDGWARMDDGALACLRCRRDRVAATALADAGLTLIDRNATTLQARAIVAFELERDPDQRPGAIAKAAGISASKVGMIRRALQVEEGAT